jgi:hypothetical protein
MQYLKIAFRDVILKAAKAILHEDTGRYKQNHLLTSKTVMTLAQKERISRNS